MQINSRFELDGHLGTIRFYGALEDKEGLFYGVEWDAAERGKHSGEYKNTQVFTVNIPGAGSFINVLKSQKINFGQGFLEALTSKYCGEIDDLEVPFGGSDMLVETVGWAKVSQKISNLQSLREVGLNAYGISSVESTGEIARTCSFIKDLDLSGNLLRSWTQIADIARELVNLEQLRLNYTRLALENTIPESSFPSLVALSLSYTLTLWETIDSLVPSLPALQHLYLTNNNLTLINSCSSAWSSIISLDISNNSLDWKSIAPLFALNLKSLNIASNSISELKFSDDAFQRLEYLNVSDNKIDSLQSIFAINTPPSLHDLVITGNPITAALNKDGVRDIWTNTVARLPKITRLNRSEVTARKRTNAELYYVSKFMGMEDCKYEYFREHYKKLCSKYGRDEENQVVAKPGGVRAGMVEICLNNSGTGLSVTKLVNAKLSVRAVKSLIARVIYPKTWRDVIGGTSVVVCRRLDGTVEEMEDEMKCLDEYIVGSGDSLEIRPR